jgi:hypothetical protein
MMNTREVAVRCRMGRMFRQADESYHACACPGLGNAIMITRLAGAPSSETPCRLGSSAYFRYAITSSDVAA